MSESLPTIFGLTLLREIVRPFEAGARGSSASTAGAVGVFVFLREGAGGSGSDSAAAARLLLPEATLDFD